MTRRSTLPALVATMLAVAAGLLAAACSQPRACSSSEDCFRGQACSESICIDRVTARADGGDTGRPPDDSTSPPRDTSQPDDTDQTDPPDTGSPPSDSSPGDTSPPEDTGTTDDTGMRKVCNGTGAQGPCTRDFSTECRTHGSVDHQAKLGCLRDQMPGAVTEVSPVDHCFCGADEQRRDDLRAILKYGNFAPNCPWTEGTIVVDVTVDVQGCNAAEFANLSLTAFNKPCPETQSPNSDGWFWCESKPAAKQLVLHWHVPIKDAQQQKSLEFSLKSSRDISFTYEYSARGTLME